MEGKPRERKTNLFYIFYFIYFCVCVCVCLRSLWLAGSSYRNTNPGGWTDASVSERLARSYLFFVVSFFSSESWKERKKRYEREHGIT